MVGAIFNVHPLGVEDCCWDKTQTENKKLLSSDYVNDVKL